MVLLLQHGASPDSATHDLYTALHIAAKEGHEEVVRILLEHGANQALMTNVRRILFIYLFVYLFIYLRTYSLIYLLTFLFIYLLIIYLFIY